MPPLAGLRDGVRATLAFVGNNTGGVDVPGTVDLRLRVPWTAIAGMWPDVVSGGKET